MKSTLLLILVVFCSVLQAGSSPKEAAKELVARYVKALEEKKKTLMDGVVYTPFRHIECGVTKILSKDQLFKLALISKITDFKHTISNEHMNKEKNVMKFNVVWKAIGKKYDVEAVLDNGIWKMKTQSVLRTCK